MGVINHGDSVRKTSQVSSATSDRRVSGQVPSSMLTPAVPMSSGIMSHHSNHSSSKTDSVVIPHDGSSFQPESHNPSIDHSVQAETLDNKITNNITSVTPLTSMGGKFTGTTYTTTGASRPSDVISSTQYSSGVGRTSGVLMSGGAYTSSSPIQMSSQISCSGNRILGSSDLAGYMSSSNVYKHSGSEARESTSVVHSYLDYANQKVTENVVRREAGEMRVISVTERVDESRIHVVGERIVEHEVRVPKKIIREDIIERVVIIPEKVIVEEIVNEACKVKEKIIEVARPITVEKVIEVPEYEYVERIVEVPEKVVQERVKHVDKTVYEDRIQEVIKIIPQERIVEVPEVQYREVPVERVVEVEEWREEVRVREVPVSQYIERPVPNVVEIEQAVDISRHVPVPVEAETVCSVRVPEIRPRYKRMTYPVYLPKFIEVPMALDLMGQQLHVESQDFIGQINELTRTAASLCDVENLASNIMKADHMYIIQEAHSANKMQSVIMDAWNSGRINNMSEGVMPCSPRQQFTQTYVSNGIGAQSIHRESAQMQVGSPF